ARSHPASWRSRGQDPFRDGERLAHRCHVVDTEHPGAIGVRDHVRSDRPAEPLVDAGPGELPDEALARAAEDDRPAELRELPEAAVELEVVLDGLAEADTGIDPDALR